jgi:hypothetical protein
MSNEKLPIKIGATVPIELQLQALKVAREEMPGIGMSGTVRLALARLAGVPENIAQLPIGRPRKISESATD